MPGHGAQEHQTLGDAFNLAGLAAIAAGDNLLSQLGGEQAYAAEIQLDFEYGTAFWVAYGLHVVDQRWRIALGITVGQAGEVPLQPNTKLPEAELAYGLRVVEASEGSLRLRTVPMQVRDALNGKWMAAFLALIALGQGAEKVPAAVDAVRGDGAKCNVTYNHELSPEARKFAAEVLGKLPPACSLEFELKGANDAHVKGRVRPEQ